MTATGNTEAPKVWSTFQTAIFEFISKGRGNAIVEAVAGSGKSSTIKEAFKRLPRGKSAVFLAFNKAIAEELSKAGVNGRTFHSLCMGPVLRARRANGPDLNKLQAMVRRTLTGDQETQYAPIVTKLVGLARQSGIGCLVRDSEGVWFDLIEQHDLEVPENGNAYDAVSLARKVLDASNASNAVDFDDMLYFAVKDGISLPKFDYVFVDEAQDTNASQRAILRKVMAPGARLIAVGDPAQAIYGFRGADSRSLALLAEEFGAVTLPLSISYRCATSVVTYAQQWVRHIQPAPGAPEGKVSELGSAFKLTDFSPADLVVSRKTAPLLTLAFRFVAEGIPVQVLGREIGASLHALIKKMNARSFGQLSLKLEGYLERETEKNLASGDESKTQGLTDRVESLQAVIRALPEGKQTLPALAAAIDNLFADKSKAVKLCTIHKSKGLEADKVWWLGRASCPAKWARLEWQKEQERNLCYVAATRAKTELVTIEIE